MGFREFMHPIAIALWSSAALFKTSISQSKSSNVNLQNGTSNATYRTESSNVSSAGASRVQAGGELRAPTCSERRAPTPSNAPACLTPLAHRHVSTPPTHRHASHPRGAPACLAPTHRHVSTPQRTGLSQPLNAPACLTPLTHRHVSNPRGAPACGGGTFHLKTRKKHESRPLWCAFFKSR